MTQQIETEILVAGAGPVGLVLAMALDRRGVDVLMCEERPRGQPPSVKCNHVSSRSMEILRDLGVAGAVRAGGLPDEFPHDCVYRTTVTGEEITRVTIPSRAERRDGSNPGPDAHWPTAEPPHRINQIYLEPILFAAAEARPHVRILDRTTLERFEQDENGVTAWLRDLASGDVRQVRARYLVGCDGARSVVRHGIGAKLHGDAIVQRTQSTYIRAPKLLDLIPGRPGWMNLSLNPRRSGNTIAIDGRETWLIHNYLYEHESDFDAIDRDASIRTILGVGADFQYEILSNEDWIGRRLVTDKMRDGRVFLAGDAAHLWVPYAGYGMNAGIADAADLAWMLAGEIAGWADVQLLDAYEAERLPITEQVSHFAMNHAVAAIKHRREVPAEIEAAGTVGVEARRRLGEAVYALNVQQYCCGGLNYGYFYDRSPVIAYDGETAPGYTMAAFTPSTVPGCRTPHLFLAGGRSSYDAMGSGFALLRSDPSVEVATLLDEAARLRLPLQLVDLPAGSLPEALVLSRPDRHVAWRGQASPVQPRALLDQVRGHGIGQAATPTG